MQPVAPSPIKARCLLWGRNVPDRKISRRKFLITAGGTAAIATTATIAETGCASMPKAGKVAGDHVCEQIYCRYFGDGRCRLKVRAAGEGR